MESPSQINKKYWLPALEDRNVNEISFHRSGRSDVGGWLLGMERNGLVRLHEIGHYLSFLTFPLFMRIWVPPNTIILHADWLWFTDPDLVDWTSISATDSKFSIHQKYSNRLHFPQFRHFEVRLRILTWSSCTYLGAGVDCVANVEATRSVQEHPIQKIRLSWSVHASYWNDTKRAWQSLQVLICLFIKFEFYTKQIERSGTVLWGRVLHPGWRWTV